MSAGLGIEYELLVYSLPAPHMISLRQAANILTRLFDWSHLIINIPLVLSHIIPSSTFIIRCLGISASFIPHSSDLHSKMTHPCVTITFFVRSHDMRPVSLYPLLIFCCYSTLEFDEYILGIEKRSLDQLSFAFTSWGDSTSKRSGRGENSLCVSGSSRIVEWTN